MDSTNKNASNQKEAKTEKSKRKKRPHSDTESSGGSRQGNAGHQGERYNNQGRR